MQCIFDPELRCLNTYWSRGVEILSCWSENKDFLTALKWYIDNPIPSIPFEISIKGKNRRYKDKRMLKRSEVYGWFNDFLHPGRNNVEVIEPWLQSGALDIDTQIRAQPIVMSHSICDVLTRAEVHYWASTLRFRDD